ncbi:MAG: AAA family ATPase [Deltaproteobacteria bacterium]
MYESFFGLEEPPFRLTPDPRYLFLSRRHREALGHLSFGLRDGAGFVAITGEIGAGKTTLLRSVLRAPDAGVQYAYVMNPILTGVEVLQEINHELGITEEGGRRELLGALNACLLERKREGRQVVIVVDEAQALDGAILEELRMLSNFETETSKLLQIVLVGQPELRELLARPELTQLNQRITVRFHLTALDKKETGEYVEHRLGIASRVGPREIFTRAALARIHRHTRGLPRLINQLCHRALLVAYAADHSRVTRRLVDRAAAELKETLAPSRPSRRSFGLEAAVAVLALGVLASVAVAVWRWPPGMEPAVLAVEKSEIQVSQIELGEVSLDDLAPVPDMPGPVVAEGAPMAAFAGMLRHASAAHSAYEAIESILRVWPAAPLSPAESAAGAFDLATIARARALSYVSVEADLSLLRVLDLPAILEIEVPGEAKPRFGLLERLGRDTAVFHFAGEPMQIPTDLLASVWTGQAHYFWEDIDELGALLAEGSSGPEVDRLHLLLADVGVYRGEGGAQYDAGTAAAVARFQQRMGLATDGKVGPLTMIALYRKGVPGAMPRLAHAPEPVEIHAGGIAPAVVAGHILPGEVRP